MRFSPAAIALSLSLALISSAGFSKRPDAVIDPQSLLMMASGDDAAKAKDFAGAVDYYETALAADPRNRVAFIAIARAESALGLHGKAIRFYKEALILDPNDQTALTEQGLAMVAKGAVGPAKSNLARLRLLCQGECATVDGLAKAIDTAGQAKALAASTVAIKPVVEVQK